MDEYTPDTELIRKRVGMYPTYGTRDEWLEAFDRWLAKVIAEAEERGYSAGYNQGYRDAVEPGVVYDA